jgi:drug/metabolite transporter (DMT)-like permease
MSKNCNNVSRDSLIPQSSMFYIMVVFCIALSKNGVITHVPFYTFIAVRSLDIILGQREILNVKKWIFSVLVMLPALVVVSSVDYQFFWSHQIVQWLSIVVVILSCLCIFKYSPWY